MKISFNWLKDYIETDLSAEKVAEILTDTGLEVEGLEKVESIKGGLAGIVVGEVLTKEKHPDADRLSVTTVNVGNGEDLQIVCGAPNVAAGQKVLVATVGATLYPNPEDSFKIKKSKIRGIESNGMICAEDELGLGDSHDGILVLEDEVAVGTKARDYFNIQDDYLIEIGLTPNRADAMGHIGVARDLKAYLNFHQKSNLSLQLPAINFAIPTNREIDIRILDTDACPHYAGAIIKDVQVKESPDWLQNKLRIIGLKPINNIVDITNFVMHETGNPLHAFDLKVVGTEIIIRKAEKGEKLITLDEVERELNEDDLMICNSTHPMCIAGVFGGIDSGVQESTKDIFLEAAYFNPVTIRKTAKRHALNTDSSFRFERGVDPDTVIYALKRAVQLILEIAGGTLSALQDDYPNPIKGYQVEFSFANCRKLTGTNITNEETLAILNELDINAVEVDKETALLNIPAYRIDVQREADLIEEVLRIYGYNKVPVPEKLNASLSIQNKPNKEKIYNRIANFLVDNGFYEIMNNSLTNSSIWEKVKTNSYLPDQDVHLLNPLSIELDVMRQSMLFGGLRTIEYNQNRQNSNIKTFEFGKEYKKVNGKYIEINKLGIWLSGNNKAENWANPTEKTDFFQLKGIVEGLLKKVGVFVNPKSSSIENDLLEDGICFSVANKEIASFGWIRKDIQQEFGIKETVFYADINWDTLIDLSKINKVEYKTLPKTQFVRRDFSLLLDQEISFAQIKEIAVKVDRNILREVGLFDVYTGKNLEKGKKSYAVSFIFQDDEKTLKDEQIDAVMDKIRSNLESKLGAELR